MVTHRSHVQKTQAGHHGGLRRGTAAAALGVVLALSAGAPAAHAATGVSASVPAGSDLLSIDLDGVLDGLLDHSEDPTPSPSSPQPSPSEDPDEPEPSRPPRQSPAPSPTLTPQPTTPAAPAVPQPTTPAAPSPPCLRSSRPPARSPRRRPPAEVPAVKCPAPKRRPLKSRAGAAPSTTAPASPSAAAASPTATGGPATASAKPALRQHVDGGHVNAPARRTVPLAGPGDRTRGTVPRRRCCGPADAPRLSGAEYSLPGGLDPEPKSTRWIDVK